MGVAMHQNGELQLHKFCSRCLKINHVIKSAASAGSLMFKMQQRPYLPFVRAEPSSMGSPAYRGGCARSRLLHAKDLQAYQPKSGSLSGAKSRCFSSNEIQQLQLGRRMVGKGKGFACLASCLAADPHCFLTDALGPYDTQSHSTAISFFLIHKDECRLLALFRVIQSHCQPHPNEAPRPTQWKSD